VNCFTVYVPRNVPGNITSKLMKLYRDKIEYSKLDSISLWRY